MTQFWNRKRVLVTGATGLVGSWIIRKLIDEKACVTALIRDFNPQSELIRSSLFSQAAITQGDLSDYDSIERAINENEIEAVFHLGAQTIVGTALRNPLSTFESNIRGTYNLFEACRRHTSLVKRIVVASSDKAYGDSDELPYTEEMPLQGRHPYDVSKSCADLIALSYFHTYQLPVAIARCGNIYGGGDLNWSRIVPGTIRSLLEGTAPIIRSNGTLTRDYLYVQDVVDAYLLLAEKLESPDVKGKAFNFGPNQPISAAEIVQTIQRLMDSPLSPKILYLGQGEIQHQALSSKRAAGLLGWKLHYSLEEGLKETIAWYRNHLSGCRKELVFQ